MARIRNIKPEFYSHEELQDMEVEHPELHPMLVFSGLWTQCEWSGVFHWSIRKLKLSLLPFLDYDLEKALEYLERHNFIKKFSRDGKDYGFVYNFSKYQAISGHEKSTELKYPVPTHEELQNSDTKNTNRDYTRTKQGQDRDYTGSPDIDIDSDIGHRTKDSDIDIDSKCDDVSVSENSETKKSASPAEHFIYLWQHNGDIFNALAPFKKPNEWNAFWARSNITNEQIDRAMTNFIEAIKSGAMERRFVPANPDTFVLNGWILKSQDPYRKQSPPPSTGKSASGPKKSLGGLES
jgi:hypothetical protein